MKKHKKGFLYVERAAKWIDVGIAVLLLMIIVVKVAEISLELVVDTDYNFLNKEFGEILSIMLGFVVGIEFVKMMCKHTSESVVDLLLFAIARQIIAEHASMWETLIGVVIISGLFAVKRFLIRRHKSEEEQEQEREQEREREKKEIIKL